MGQYRRSGIFSLNLWLGSLLYTNFTTILSKNHTYCGYFNDWQPSFSTLIEVVSETEYTHKMGLSFLLWLSHGGTTAKLRGAFLTCNQVSNNQCMPCRTRIHTSWWPAAAREDIMRIPWRYWRSKWRNGTAPLFTQYAPRFPLSINRQIIMAYCSYREVHAEAVKNADKTFLLHCITKFKLNIPM